MGLFWFAGARSLLWEMAQILLIASRLFSKLTVNSGETDGKDRR
jgi:hypothetical protein